MPPFTTNMMKRLGIAPIADTLMKAPAREKGEGMPSTNVYHENAVHQADLLFLPHDKVGRKTYKCALVVVDLHTGYTDAEPLTEKTAASPATTTGLSRAILSPTRTVGLLKMQNYSV